MPSLHNLKSAIVSIFFAVIIFSGCSKKGTPNPTPRSGDAISSLSVNAGSYNTQLIITGIGFSAIATDQQVFFNGKPAVITAATTTQLTTNVPLSAGSGAITIKYRDGVTVKGPVFTYQVALVAVTIAGNGTQGYADGTGRSAIFHGPTGTAVDKTGNIFVTDAANNRIRKITPDGVVTTFAGSGAKGSADGVGTSASFEAPQFIAIDNSGNLFVTDGNTYHLVRKITPQGVVSTYAGGNSGYKDGPASTAEFGSLYGISIDNNGNIFVCDGGTNHVRKITPNGQVSTVGKNVISFDYPFQALTDHLNNLYITNLGDETIRKITPAGVMTYVMNSDGTSKFFNLQGMTIDANAVIYISDNSVIKKIVNDKVTSNYAGGPSLELPTDGAVSNVSFLGPFGITIDTSGNLYIAQALVNIITKISTQ